MSDHGVPLGDAVSEITVREARRDDLDELAAVMARAFEDDPLMKWILPNDRTRLARMTAMERAVSHKVALPIGRHILTTDELAGMAVWAPPNTWKVPTSKFVTVGPQMIATLRGGLIRLMRGFAVLEKAHPHEPHWYLEGLGTDPKWQRRGVGGALMAPVLARCDDEGVPAYLETQKQANVPYYRKHGFEVIREVDLPARGPHMWLMWREPGAARA